MCKKDLIGIIIAIGIIGAWITDTIISLPKDGCNKPIGTLIVRQEPVTYGDYYNHTREIDTIRNVCSYKIKVAKGRGVGHYVEYRYHIKGKCVVGTLPFYGNIANPDISFIK